eukprot:GHVL01019792.1.p1 GENE.GHVL01019792.1~~GHVL01019792.1.p1  ORF type:complete len:276 (+),score=44.56 GHVL01019792.1:51-830(+)
MGRSGIMTLLVWFSVFVSILCVFFNLFNVDNTRRLSSPHTVVKNPQKSRFAFGSCIQWKVARQPVWHSIIDLKPDVWIWGGDLVYGDLPHGRYCDEKIDDCPCNGLEVPGSMCLSGNVTRMMDAYSRQLSNTEYRAFLEYMCRGYVKHGDIYPQGVDCEGSIIGVWDDHDYGWNDGNKRLSSKFEIKQLFLDAIGEPQGSHRRSALRGIEMFYIFNKDDKNRQVSVFLLDERYYRDPLSCSTEKKLTKLKNTETTVSII